MVYPEVATHPSAKGGERRPLDAQTSPHRSRPHRSNPAIGRSGETRPVAPRRLAPALLAALLLAPFAHAQDEAQDEAQDPGQDPGREAPEEPEQRPPAAVEVPRPGPVQLSGPDVGEIAPEEAPDPEVERRRVAEASSPTVRHLAEVVRRLGEERYEEAEAALLEAEKAAAEGSVRDRADLAGALFILGYYPRAAAAGESWVAASIDDRLRAHAHHLVGLAHLWQALSGQWSSWTVGNRRIGGEDAEAPTVEESLAAAAASLRRAVELDREVAIPAARLHLADALERAGEPEEAREQLAAYRAAGGEGVEADELACRLGSPSLQGDARSEVFEAGAENVVEPRKIEAPFPTYTDVARRLRVEGDVVVQTVITREGVPVCLKVLDGLPNGLVPSVLETLESWRFEPATLDGRPVDVYFNLTIHFTIE